MRRSTAYLFMLLHVGLAAGTYVTAKPAAVAFADPAALTFLRVAGAAVLLLGLTGWLIPRPRFSAREWIEIAALGLLLIWGNQYCFLRGMQDTVPTHPALLYALTPLGVLLLANLLRRRRPPRVQLAGVLLALLGVFIVLRPWQGGSRAGELRSGDAWCLAAVAGWVVYTVGARRISRAHDSRAVTAWTLILGALFMFPAGVPALLRMDLREVRAEAWLGVLYLAVFTSVVMMLLWNKLLRHLEAVQVAICANAQPVVTALLAALLAWLGYLRGDQDLGSFYWLGLVLVLAGVALVQRRAPE